MLVRDEVANIVIRLRECGFDPRRVGEDAWESRCPGHGGSENALCITRSERNQALLECRATQNCHPSKIIGSLGFNNDDVCAQTPEWLIASLRRTEVEEPWFTTVAASSAPKDAVAATAGEFTSWEAQAGPIDNVTVAAPLPTATPHHPHVAIGEIARAEPPTEGSTDPGPDRSDNSASLNAETSSSGSGGGLPALGADASDLPVEAVGETPTDAMMRIAGIERVIFGTDGRSYAVVRVNGHAQCRELKSKALRHLMTRAALKATGKLPGPEAISAVVSALEAIAEFEGEQEDVFFRVACGSGGLSYFLDLADRDGWVIEITADGWRPVLDSPVLMRRARGQLALPMPQRGGSIELLKTYVNIQESDWPLFIGWLTAAVRPVGPHPILVVTGEQGSAKTTLLKVCRRLIDPNSSPVRSPPKETRDLMIAARKSWLMVYHNLTTLPTWFSNGLCGLATGTGFTIRSLGTDDEESILVAERPIMLDGIGDFVVEPDLADRSFFLMVDLLGVLANNRPRQASSSDWPTTPRALSCKLRRLAPQLRTIGIDVKFDRIGNKRIVTIEAQSA